MRFQQKVLGFSGGVMTTFGLGSLILGWQVWSTVVLASLTDATEVNAAAGVAMWTGLVIIMCGISNIIAAFDSKKKTPSLYALPFSVSVFFMNLVAIATAAICIGLLTWSLHEQYLENEQTTDNGMAVVGLYSTLVVAHCLILIFALLAMSVDCCLSAVMQPPIPEPVYGLTKPNGLSFMN
ncbi:uncharacterized protein [Diadema antillarum]|uniref:uncharacterized protein n=1 Tax=Diadema antillarum TaxID=105358 RepID=UPI003A873CA3